MFMLSKGLTSFASKNPLLKNITDYLVDEADAEEEELLGIDSSKPKSADDDIPMGENNIQWYVYEQGLVHRTRPFTGI